MRDRVHGHVSWTKQKSVLLVEPNSLIVLSFLGCIATHAIKLYILSMSSRQMNWCIATIYFFNLIVYINMINTIWQYDRFYVDKQ